MQSELKYFFLLLAIVHSSNSKVCTSIDVKNDVANLEKLRNCTVVEGFVQIVLIEPLVGFVEADFEPYSFPELREVTEYMIFFRVKWLRSLGKLFPNLEKIGGTVLFLDYALVVVEMFSLQEIGLSNLKEITRGSVIAWKNQNLCFVKTVKWENIIRWNAMPIYADQNAEDATWNSSCPGCPDHCPKKVCWNATQCQFETTVSQCHPLCTGRCSNQGPDGCYTCKGYYDLQGNCVYTCPENTYKYLNRRCVTREQCNKTSTLSRKVDSDPPNSYVIYEDQCRDSCPSGQEKDHLVVECRPCKEGRCLKWCRGAVISSTGGAQQFRGCTHINGSIEITINLERSGADHSFLEENLGSIEQITGYLKVSRSSVTDLNFLKNLSLIHGIHTQKNLTQKTLVISDNENLQDLWDWEVKRNFSIANGEVHFYYNPKLCLDRIYAFLNKIGYNKTVSSFYIDKESNGDKFLCNATEINITVTEITSDRIQVYVPYTEVISVLRYLVYYTKDPYKNITIFDDLNKCSDFGWMTKDISVMDSNEQDYKTNGLKVDLTDLEPATFYVFYVTTYTVSNISARSRVTRKCTLPSTPSEITRLQAFGISSSEIELRWEPPNRVNGKLQEYIVTWYELNEDRAFIDQRNYCLNPMVPAHNRTEPHESEEKLPESQSRNKSGCCPIQQKQLLPKDEFEMLCNNFENIPKGFPDRSKFVSCESFFYSYIYDSPFSPTNQVNLVTLQKTSTNYFEGHARKKLGLNKYVLTSQNQIPGDDLKGKYQIKTKVKSRSLNPNSKGVVLRELNHFQKYVISVKACREAYDGETDVGKSENNRCSKSEIVSERTRENKESDSIPQHAVKYEVVEKVKLKVNWAPPANPNGLIVAFEIEYRNKDLENPKNGKECLTYTDYENHNTQWFIDGLPPGKYEFRIRAISLFGGGPFTEYIAFDIQNEKEKSLLIVYLIILSVLALVILIFICMAPSCFHNTSKNKTIIVDVNPNYHYVADSYEIDRDDVEFGYELGLGSFGKVYEGRWKSRNLRCAIKTVNEDATAENENEFLIEASIMKSMINAYYIVEIYGVVSRGRPPLVLMELMERGDLKTYLRTMRESNPITNATMIKMALEIADGMAYMEAHKFVHRDLAARNCMVSSELTIKVGDFGMARDIYETDYYRKKNKGFLPIRWMAPESLKDGEYTSQSDVWSYGVVLWEIVTMAEQPYQGFSNDQVLHDVIAGRRLEIPKSSPLHLKEIMKRCWESKPASRLSFMNIVEKLEYLHDEEFKRVSYYHSVEAEAFRKGMWEYVEMKSLVDTPSTSYSLTTGGEEGTC